MKMNLINLIKELDKIDDNEPGARERLYLVIDLATEVRNIKSNLSLLSKEQAILYLCEEFGLEKPYFDTTITR